MTGTTINIAGSNNDSNLVLTSPSGSISDSTPNSFPELNSTLSQVKSDISGVKSDISGVKSDINTIKEEPYQRSLSIKEIDQPSSEDTKYGIVYIPNADDCIQVLENSGNIAEDISKSGLMGHLIEYDYYTYDDYDYDKEKETGQIQELGTTLGRFAGNGTAIHYFKIYKDGDEFYLGLYGNIGYKNGASIAHQCKITRTKYLENKVMKRLHGPVDVPNDEPVKGTLVFEVQDISPFPYFAYNNAASQGQPDDGHMEWFSILGNKSTNDTPTFLFSLAINKDLKQSTSAYSGIKPFISGMSTSFAFFVKYGSHKINYLEIVEANYPKWQNKTPESMSSVKLVDVPEPYLKISWWNLQFSMYVQNTLTKIANSAGVDIEPFSKWNVKKFLY